MQSELFYTQFKEYIQKIDRKPATDEYTQFVFHYFRQCRHCKDIIIFDTEAEQIIEHAESLEDVLREINRRVVSHKGCL